MRVLFATYAEKTHFYLMAPLAWALQTAGHDVRVASQPEITDVVTGAGLTAVPVGQNHSFWRVLRSYPIMDPRRDRVPPYGLSEMAAADITYEYLRDGYRQVVPWWWRMLNDSMVDDLVGFCREWRPDLVVWDQITYAGAIAARVCGAAHARFLWSADLFARMRLHYLRLLRDRPDGEDPLRDWLSGQVHRFGATYSEDLTTGHFTLDYFTSALRADPSLDLDLPLRYVAMRYVPYNGPAVVQPWLRTDPERPRVCLTLGTVATDRFDGYSVPVKDILDALSDLDVEFVATVPDTVRQSLEPVPANARLFPFVPLHTLIPTCRLVIHHGGNGSYCTTLASGVPHLMLYNMLDTPVRARYIVNQGAGLAIHSTEVTGASGREAVLRLLTEPGFTAQARRLRQEMALLPTPNDIVPEIEALTESNGARV
jgi:glycosyltransferase (activator-dependent family)